MTDYNDVKVVILGQDPYHGIGEANGLSFSVNDGVRIPPSLQNIYKELYNDLGCEIAKTGNLEPWAKQGVLLLNAVLTVTKDKPASHKNKGWELFTDAIIKKVNEKETPVVFLLWGSFARGKKNLITNPRHLIIESTIFSLKRFFWKQTIFKDKQFLKSKWYQRNRLENKKMIS